MGAPIGRGFKRGLETKVSKRSVFTPKTLENILQDSLRRTASIQMLIYYNVFVKGKQKGKNHDLTVAEYKVQQATRRLETVENRIDEKEDLLYNTFVRLEQMEKKVSEAESRLSGTKKEIAGAEKDLIQIKTEGRETKQKLQAEQEEIKEENLSLKTDTLILRSKKEILVNDVSRAENEMEQMKMKKDGLLEDIGVLDQEFDRRLDFISMLDKLKILLYKLFSMIPLVREFTKLAEKKRDIRAASSYGYTPLGRLLKEYRIPIPHYEKFVTFPEIASWQTSKGEVVLAYDDFKMRGRLLRILFKSCLNERKGYVKISIRKSPSTGW
ncbi:MAG: hypothetical protein NC121_03670 [Blautia sp.]|nr:hypothetical protein [Blautia sp.]